MKTRQIRIIRIQSLNLDWLCLIKIWYQLCVKTNGKIGKGKASHVTKSMVCQMLGEILNFASVLSYLNKCFQHPYSSNFFHPSLKFNFCFSVLYTASENNQFMQDQGNAHLCPDILLFHMVPQANKVYSYTLIKNETRDRLSFLSTSFVFIQNSRVLFNIIFSHSY